MPYEHSSISKKYLVLCEGADVEGFLICYLNSRELAFESRFSQDIQTFDFKGIDNLVNFLRNLKNMEHFEEVTQILVLRDAETDVKKAIHMVQTAFRKNDLPIPEECNCWQGGEDLPRTAFTLFPTCSKEPRPGALEDLCWELLKHKEIDTFRTDIQEFVSLAREKYHSVSTHEHKSRLHTYLSVNEDYISLKIGEAAKAGAFDWTSEKLYPLRELLLEEFL